jgi:hypothetical protein
MELLINYIGILIIELGIIALCLLFKFNNKDEIFLFDFDKEYNVYQNQNFLGKFKSITIKNNIIICERDNKKIYFSNINIQIFQ